MEYTCTYVASLECDSLCTATHICNKLIIIDACDDRRQHLHAIPLSAVAFMLPFIYSVRKAVGEAARSGTGKHNVLQGGNSEYLRGGSVAILPLASLIGLTKSRVLTRNCLNN